MTRGDGVLGVLNTFRLSGDKKVGLRGKEGHDVSIVYQGCCIQAYVG